jgi:hypothetical protein
MPVVSPNELLAGAGLSEREAPLEIACRLYNTGTSDSLGSERQ